MVLLELRKFYPKIFEKIEIHIDGGIRRGTDILKALCLGATGVSLGRPFLFSVLYGEQGVDHLIRSKFRHFFLLAPFLSLLNITDCRTNT